MTIILFGFTDLSKRVYSNNKSKYVIVDEFKHYDNEEIKIEHTSNLNTFKHSESVILCDLERFDKHLNFLRMIGYEEKRIETMNINGSVIPISDIKEIRKKTVFVNTLPKSGTSWIDRSLRQAYRMKTTNLQGKMFLNKMDNEEVLNPSFISKRMKNGSLNISHLNFNNMNAELIRKSLENKNVYFIIHIRDPRQAIISWLHYEDKVFKENTYQKIARGYSEEYFNLTFYERIDVQINCRFREFVKWVSDWLTFHNSLDNDRCMISTHELLTKSPVEFNESYRNFLNMPNNTLFLHDKPKKDSFNYRSGESDEWKKVVRNDQIKKMSDILMEFNLLDFFDNL